MFCKNSYHMIVIKVCEKLLVKEFKIELTHRYFSNILPLVAERLYCGKAFWCTAFPTAHILLIASRYITFFNYFFHSFFLLGHEKQKTDYNVEEVINFVLEPGSDFELCGFSEGSDTEDEIEQIANIKDNGDLAVNLINCKK